MTRPYGVIELDPFWPVDPFDSFLLWGSPQEVFVGRYRSYVAFRQAVAGLGMERFREPLTLVSQPPPPTIAGRRITAILHTPHLTPGA